MTLSDEDVSDSDDDMISCHICLLRFNTTDRKPKYLDCHHYFCFNCIKGFSKTNNVHCPTCRSSTNMSGRQIEDLATNNIVIRLVTIATDRARELAERGKKEQMYSGTPNKMHISLQSPTNKNKEMWCSQCSVFSTPACRLKRHVLRDSIEVLKENMEVVEGRVSECCSMWDKAIEDRQRVHQYYDDILNSMRIVQNDVMNRIEVNDSNIALMESRKQVARDLCRAASIQNTEDDIARAMAKTKNAIEQLNGWNGDGNRCQFVSRQLLQNLMTIEENCIDVSFANGDPTKRSLLSTELLKHLQLSFNGLNQPEPVVKACVSVLSFVILKVAEDQSKQTNGQFNRNQVNTNGGGLVNGAANEQANRYSNGEVKAQAIECNKQIQINRIEKNIPIKPAAGGPVKQPPIQASNQSSNGHASPNNSAAARVPAKQHAEPSSFRDSLLKAPVVKTTNEWQTVTKSSGKEVKSVVNGGGGGESSGKNKCYFRMNINGVMSERIIAQLEKAKAPIMCAKFIEMCTKKDGYKGSKIYKTIKGESVFCSSGWFHTFDLDQRCDVFTADKSDVAEQRGSMRFQIKKSENGIAQVSTEFNVILANRPRHHRSTSVFAQIIEGLTVFDQISGMDMKQNRVIFAECGVC
ncbi:uncharacterized protein LOC124315198 isoform X1 [Daphnia pulicaria]|uniref:uncharacterized protein LOC124315198 isoform X1 n=1 Tax=Daphnia pulicaria TaxID=35523 RepID=UPI001EEB7629|nr:uncharacterized protein LOC124315198 isoform X1 [Daphnia pulicaria]XP_046636654.1 uncharacterized protein LOC124315198 isoform X1 [Daphnia pulicaria]XP_046636655.1 uncharacterized protein LOC124315198 isoform X1 [Daphnia pulicaria]XP_046636656.1 uncharacterized protein LOC124315198 isoform X1 [Daphnia pulicaria]